MERRVIEVPGRGLTHAGVFHADEVFATALLRVLNPAIEVTRSNAVPDGFEGIVYDMGGGEFDHHRGGTRVRANGVPYSSFGLVWERFGRGLVDGEGFAAIDGGLVQPIDLTDNTGEPNPLSRCVSDFNPPPGARPSDFDAAFSDAVAWAQGVLERRLASARRASEARRHVEGRVASADGPVLVLERYVPWKEAAVGSSLAYVVFPSVRGGWCAQCVPERLGDGSMVRPFPEGWRGLTGAALRDATGVADATFCHAAGFLCCAETREGALELARRSMESSQA